jgi:hypothetical protein
MESKGVRKIIKNRVREGGERRRGSLVSCSIVPDRYPKGHEVTGRVSEALALAHDITSHHIEREDRAAESRIVMSCAYNMDLTGPKLH